MTLHDANSAPRHKGHARTNPIGRALEQQQTLMIDGGLATELERRGADLRHELWSARMLSENPGLIREAHRAFLEYGADIIITASYQASYPGFERAGFDRETAARMMRRSVALACEARDEFWADSPPWSRLRPLVAASIGPYGACQADGSEYRGDYGLSKQQLKDFHMPRMELLAASQADFLAMETIPCLLEAEALLECLETIPNRFAWLSFSCKDAMHVCHGETFADCARLADQHPQVAAVGINCTPPQFVPDLLNAAAWIVTPFLAYPNSGEGWDAGAREWTGQGASLDPSSWVAAGARLVGGCCRVGPDEIAGMRQCLEGGVR